MNRKVTKGIYTLTDSFEAVSIVKSIVDNPFAEGHQIISYDVESLFTNMPLNRTVNIILDRNLQPKS